MNNQNQSMAQRSMARSGLHQGTDRGDTHYTIQRDDRAPKGTIGNNVGHVYPNGSAKAINGGSIRWALPR